MATRTVMLSSVYSKPFIWNVNGYTNGLAQWLKMNIILTSFCSLFFSTRKIESKMYMWREKLHYYVYTSLYSKLSLLEVITWAQGVADHWLEDFWCTTTKIRVLERHTNIDDEPVDQHHEMKNAPNMHHIIKKVLFFLQPYLMSKLSISWLQTLRNPER